MSGLERFATELYDLESWNEGRKESDKISIFDYLCFSATPDLFFAFNSLFFPELEKFDGIAFIKARFNEEGYRTWKNTDLTPREIQRVINHIHIRTLFQQEPLSDEFAKFIAETIKSSWDVVFEKENLVGEVHGEDYGDISITLVSCSPAGEGKDA